MSQMISVSMEICAAYPPLASLDRFGGQSAGSAKPSARSPPKHPRRPSFPTLPDRPAESSAEIPVVSDAPANPADTAAQECDV
jgi:hypothetical protein